MDPDSAAAFAALVLALLGAMRRSGRSVADRPTAGEILAERGTELSRAAAFAGGGLGRLATGAAAGTISVCGLTAATLVRVMGSFSASVGAGMTALGGEAAARVGGLVLDGGLALGEVAHRSRPPVAARAR